MAKGKSRFLMRQSQADEALELQTEAAKAQRKGALFSTVFGLLSTVFMPATAPLIWKTVVPAAASMIGRKIGYGKDPISEGLWYGAERDKLERGFDESLWTGFLGDVGMGVIQGIKSGTPFFGKNTMLSDTGELIDKTTKKVVDHRSPFQQWRSGDSAVKFGSKFGTGEGALSNIKENTIGESIAEDEMLKIGDSPLGELDLAQLFEETPVGEDDFTKKRQGFTDLINKPYKSGVNIYSRKKY